MSRIVAIEIIKCFLEGMALEFFSQFVSIFILVLIFSNSVQAISPRFDKFLTIFLFLEFYFELWVVLQTGIP